MPKLVVFPIIRAIPFRSLSQLYPKFLFLFVLLACFKASNACDIVGASACPHKPDNDLKEENFDDYCNKYKLNIECIYDKYKGCEKKDKYADAMNSMIRGLKKKAKQLSEDCEIEIQLADDKPKPDKKKKGKDKPSGKKTKTTEPAEDDYEYEDETTTTTGVPCRINSISSDCHHLMQNVQFNTIWSGILKQKWCNSAGPYYNCLKIHMVNCHAAVYQESVSYYEKMQKYIHSTSNINCPGGLEGCSVNSNDVRCKMGVKYGETNGSIKKKYSFFFLIYAFIFYYFLGF